MSILEKNLSDAVSSNKTILSLSYTHTHTQYEKEKKSCKKYWNSISGATV